MIRSITISSGVTLQYAERGGALGIPVVFLHGVTDSWRSFEPILDRLPGTIRAFAITQRGHGNSSKPAKAIATAIWQRTYGLSWMRSKSPRPLSSDIRWAAWWRSALPSITQDVSLDWF